MLLNEVVVVVAAEFEVGRAGALRLSVEDIAGQNWLPQARSVGQQPPPRLAGQDLKPLLHTRLFGGVVLGELVEVTIVVVVVSDKMDVVLVGMLLEVVGLDVVLELVVGLSTGGVTMVVRVTVTVEAPITDVTGVEMLVGVGTTVTTVVLVCTQPTSKQAYPGKQHPPPWFGQLV